MKITWILFGMFVYRALMQYICADCRGQCPTGFMVQIHWREVRMNYKLYNAASCRLYALSSLIFLNSPRGNQRWSKCNYFLLYSNIKLFFFKKKRKSGHCLLVKPAQLPRRAQVNYLLITYIALWDTCTDDRFGPKAKLTITMCLLLRHTSMTQNTLAGVTFHKCIFKNKV